MAAIIIPNQLTLDDQVSLMQQDARFEIAGDMDAETCALNCAAQVRAQKAPPKVPKSFLASKCVFNCAYCGCRSSREGRDDYCFSPRALAQLSVDMAKKEGRGVFVTSAIHKNADYTQELLAESARIMREELLYGGYIHAKVMPGADPLLIEKTGRYADRLSVNIEVARSEGYSRIAKQKNRENILIPMRTIAGLIRGAAHDRRRFARSQSTQLMAGSTQEDDRTIMVLSQALYSTYGLKRVYYTAFHYENHARGYDDLPFSQTPYWRMARLYQADRLMQLYGFTPQDVTPENRPNLEWDIDPKTAWALGNLHLFPVEVNRADFDALIRVPGIGPTYAKKIITARRHCAITHDILVKMRVPLKRCIYFITCNGAYGGGRALGSPDLRQRLSSGAPEQMSIFSSLAHPCATE